MTDTPTRRWLRPAVLAREAYAVADARGLIKLDAMENPYPWPQALREAWSERLREVALNRYPDAGAVELKRHLRAALALPEELGLVLGNGSDELIQLLAIAFAGEGRVVLTPAPSFVMYRMVADALGMRYVPVPLRADFSLDGAAVLAAIEREQPALVFLAYPNNPTGNLFERALIDAIVAATPGLVVIDEAYHPFAGETLLELACTHANVAVLRTLSKMGFAALRLGLLLAQPRWTREFEKLRLPYNINSLSQVSASFALEHAEMFAAQAREIVAERGRVGAALAALPAVAVYPSAANFLVLRLPASVRDVAAGLRRRGVLVKDLHGADALTAHCLRVSIGTPAENDAFLAALRELL